MEQQAKLLLIGLLLIAAYYVYTVFITKSQISGAVISYDMEFRKLNKIGQWADEDEYLYVVATPRDIVSFWVNFPSGNEVYTVKLFTIVIPPGAIFPEYFNIPLIYKIPEGVQPHQIYYIHPFTGRVLEFENGRYITFVLYDRTLLRGQYPYIGPVVIYYNITTRVPGAGYAKYFYIKNVEPIPEPKIKCPTNLYIIPFTIDKDVIIFAICNTSVAIATLPYNLVRLMMFSNNKTETFYIDFDQIPVPFQPVPLLSEMLANTDLGEIEIIPYGRTIFIIDEKNEKVIKITLNKTKIQVGSIESYYYNIAKVEDVSHWFTKADEAKTIIYEKFGVQQPKLVNLFYQTHYKGVYPLDGLIRKEIYWEERFQPESRIYLYEVISGDGQVKLREWFYLKRTALLLEFKTDIQTERVQYIIQGNVSSLTKKLVLKYLINNKEYILEIEIPRDVENISYVAIFPANAYGDIYLFVASFQKGYITFIPKRNIITGNSNLRWIELKGFLKYGEGVIYILKSILVDNVNIIEKGIFVRTGIPIFPISEEMELLPENNTFAFYLDMIANEAWWGKIIYITRNATVSGIEPIIIVEGKTVRFGAISQYSPIIDKIVIEILRDNNVIYQSAYYGVPNNVEIVLDISSLLNNPGTYYAKLTVEDENNIEIETIKITTIERTQYTTTRVTTREGVKIITKQPTFEEERPIEEYERVQAVVPWYRQQWLIAAIIIIILLIMFTYYRK